MPIVLVRSLIPSCSKWPASFFDTEPNAPTGGMGKECLMFHRLLAELIAIKRGEDYAKTIAWIRTRTSTALLTSALICLRGSRRVKRVSWDFRNVDIEVETIEGTIKYNFF